MEILEQLNRKVGRAAQELIALKRERSQLITECERLQKENKDHRMLLRENEKLRENAQRLKVKLERLNKKLEQYFSIETKADLAFPGGTHEQHSI